MDLVRKILIEIESQRGGFSSKQLEDDGYSKDDIEYQLTIMLEGGLIEGAQAKLSGRYCPLISPTRLTWAGHDFLDACRDEGCWMKAKEKLKTLGGSASIDIIKMVLIEVAKSKLFNTGI